MPGSRWCACPIACNPNDPATQALMDSWPLDQLRQDPAAKRALWPQLRALRKRGAP